MCVWGGVWGVDGMNLMYTLRWHIHVPVHSMLYTSACILKPFENSEPTGLNVDADTMSHQAREKTLHRTGRGPTFTMRVDAALSRVQVPDQVEWQVFTGVAHFLHLDHAARQLQQGWRVVHQVLQVCPEQYNDRLISQNSTMTD